MSPADRSFRSHELDEVWGNQHVASFQTATGNSKNPTIDCPENKQIMPISNVPVG